MTVHNYVLDLCKALGYDFNTVEMAVRNGIPYAIDFCNPAPDADINSVGQDNIEWVVDHATRMAVDRARLQKPGADNLTWGTFARDSVSGGKVSKAKAAPEVAAKAVKKTGSKKKS